MMTNKTLKIALRTCCVIAYLSPLMAFAVTEEECTKTGGSLNKDGTCSAGETTNPTPCSEGSLSNCTLPTLTPVFSLNSKSSAQSSTAATSFKGGIAVSTNGQLAPYAIDNQNLNQGDTIVVSGTIIPLAADVGKTADILVVGLYKAKVDSTSLVDNCDPAGGEYYMNTADSTFTDIEVTQLAQK